MGKLAPSVWSGQMLKEDCNVWRPYEFVISSSQFIGNVYAAQIG